MITKHHAAGISLLFLATLTGCGSRSTGPAQVPAARSSPTPAEALAAMVKPVDGSTAQSHESLIAAQTSDEFLECGTAFAGADVASDASLATLARRIAQDYLKLNKLTDGPEHAPHLCVGPLAPNDAVMSQSDDDSTHGRKVYHMYANAMSRYYRAFTYRGLGLQPGDVPFPVGTIVVKESFKPLSEWGGVGDFTGLFMMFKVDEKSARTDEGWVYATVDRDLKTITSIGVIESCAGCHRESATDRMIGLRRHDR